MKCYMYVLIVTTKKDVHMHQRCNKLEKTNRIEVKITIHPYIERLTKCIITTSGSCDGDFSVLTGTTDPHLTVLNYWCMMFCLCFTWWLLNSCTYFGVKKYILFFFMMLSVCSWCCLCVHGVCVFMVLSVCSWCCLCVAGTVASMTLRVSSTALWPRSGSVTGAGTRPEGEFVTSLVSHTLPLPCQHFIVFYRQLLGNTRVRLDSSDLWWMQWNQQNMLPLLFGSGVKLTTIGAYQTGLPFF